MQEFEASSSYEEWDKKKIILGCLGFVVIVGIIIGVKTYILDPQEQKSTPRATKASYQQVEGTSTIATGKEKDKADAPTPTGISVPAIIQEKVGLIQQQVMKLDPQEVASSSPQVKKLLDDIKALEQVPRNSAKDLCQQMCSKL